VSFTSEVVFTKAAGGPSTVVIGLRSCRWEHAWNDSASAMKRAPRRHAGVGLRLWIETANVGMRTSVGNERMLGVG
jgi:hypothetical protein